MNELKRPPRDWVLMQSAMNWALRSTCTRAQVGTVISREGRVLSSGYNGAPSGMPHCDHRCICPKGWPRNDGKDRLKHVALCNAPKPCTTAVHAEANAIVHAALYGVGINGAELHTTRMPCRGCAGMIINAGIKRVVYYEDHRETNGLILLQQAGLEVVKYVYE